MKFSYSFIKKLLPKVPAKAKFAEDLNLYSFETENLQGDTLDISLASNRYSDAASHLGIAREASAVYGVPLKNPVKRIVNQPAGKGFLRVEVKDPKFCPRYAARYFALGKKVGASPTPIQNVLRACGLKPINAIVDVMNYVMLEVGQPLHAFDFDKVQGANPKSMEVELPYGSSTSIDGHLKKIIVRKAKNGERIETLDGQHFILSSDDFVIANGDVQRKSASGQRLSAVLAIAGIKGGSNSGVDGKTKRIIVEAANFAPASVFKTSRRLKLSTDASIRFSHGLSPALVDWGMDRATELLVKMGAKLIDSAEIYPRPAGDELIRFDVEAYKQLIGAPISTADAQRYFTALGFMVEHMRKNQHKSALNRHGSAFLVRIPSWRTDIERTEDLIEEVARLKGYNNLKPEPPAVSIRTAEEEDIILLKDRVRQFMVNVNLNEVYNYSFGSEAGSGAVALANPLNKESEFLRKSLEPGLVRNVESNSRFFDEVRIFEIGKVFHSQTVAEETRTVAEKLPRSSASSPRKSAVKEDLHMAVALGAKKKPLTLELKGLFDELLKGLGLTDFSFVPRGASLRIESDHHVLGEMKSVHLERGWNAAVGELNLDALLPLLEEEREFKPLPKYPAVIRDISLLVSSDVRIGDILAAIQDTSPKLVEDVDLIDEYQDEKFLACRSLGEGGGGNRSLTFRIVFQAEDRTLTDAEANTEMEKISSKLEKDFRAEIR